MAKRSRQSGTYDALIVGAGFAGLYALYRMRAMGLSALVIEQGGGIGGTWYWNRYPGARCDVESLQYSYSFSDDVQQEWNWTERFASQGEILKYINFVADKFDLTRDIEFNTRVVSAKYVEDNSDWQLETDKGETFRSRFLIFATGCLSVPIEPELAGLDHFEGKILRTSQWPHQPVDFSGQRVAVVGTGSSGVQTIPAVAQEAKHLYVLQRTPNYTVPGHNRPMQPEFENEWKAHYQERRLEALATRSNNLFNAGIVPGREVSWEEREREFESRWQTGGLGFAYAYPDLTSDPEVNKHASDFVRRKILEKVRNPEVAASLTPTDYSIGGRRLCVDNGYYETFNRDNVTLVDLRKKPFVTMTKHGFKVEGAEYEIDALILATGFDAITGALARVDIRGRDGLALRDKWADGPSAYLGLAVAGFPNMFTITGPGSPSVLSNMVVSVEIHVNWIAECIDFVRRNGKSTIEAKEAFEQQWVERVAAFAGVTLISKTKSWYTGANVPGKTSKVPLYMNGAHNYKKEIEMAGPSSSYGGFEIR
jgi:cyclohexanone monooxygenase